MRFVLTTLCLLWLGAAVFGLARLEQYSAEPGASNHAPARWQRTAGITLDRTRPTLVMLVHPKCPCSRASLAELNRLAALCPHQVSVFVLFWEPHGYPQTWAHTELYREAEAIPGVQVRIDQDGAAIRRFGASTSGETLLYAPDGRLLFQGGLTGSRGHEGDNLGLSAVAALLHGGSEKSDGGPEMLHETPVYGCPLTGCPVRKSGGER